MDKQLIEGIIKKDEASIRIFVSTYQDQVYNQAIRLLTRHEDAEEACQDVFLKAISHMHRFRFESKLTTWLYRIVFTTCVDKMNKGKRRSTEELNEKILSNSWYSLNAALQSLEREEQRRLIDTALCRLDSIDALVIELFHLREQSIQEISAITGMANSAVKVRLFRARKKLAILLKNALPADTINQLTPNNPHGK